MVLSRAPRAKSRKRKIPRITAAGPLRQPHQQWRERPDVEAVCDPQKQKPPVKAAFFLKIPRMAGRLPKAHLLHVIVRRFPRDDHVVHVAFTQPGTGDPHKARVFFELRDC